MAISRRLLLVGKFPLQTVCWAAEAQKKMEAPFSFGSGKVQVQVANHWDLEWARQVACLLVVHWRPIGQQQKAHNLPTLDARANLASSFASSSSSCLLARPLNKPKKPNQTQTQSCLLPFSGFPIPVPISISVAQSQSSSPSLESIRIVHFEFDLSERDEYRSETSVWRKEEK